MSLPGFDPSMRPLDGITVLDLGQVYGGPYCGLLLVHLGARVVKIEAPSRGEPLRSGVGATATADPFAFQLLNGGKESVTLDLKSVRGREAFLGLAGDADVVVENFAPGTTAALGVDYASVSAVNPRIIYASLKAYSEDTPSRDLRGMDLTVQASSAAMSVNGFPDGPPTRCGPSLADFLGGTHLALGVLAALLERDRSGRGQQVDVSLQDAVIPALASNIAGWLTDPQAAPERTGNRHGGMRESPYNVYRTADGWVAILAISEPHWRSVAELVGREDLRDDLSLAGSSGRVARIDEIDTAVGAWTGQHTSAEVSAALQQAGVPASPVRSIAQLVAEELTRSAPMIQRSEGAEHEPTYTLGAAVRLANHPPRPAGAVPSLGEHTDAVLEALRAAGNGGSSSSAKAHRNAERADGN
jgi:crotonobetainyl-CoA:carnitine CoA-transferase CaiB-like acyl-CoA transferase